MHAWPPKPGKGNFYQRENEGTESAHQEQNQLV